MLRDTYPVFNRLSFSYEAMSDLSFTIYESAIASVISDLAVDSSCMLQKHRIV